MFISQDSGYISRGLILCVVEIQRFLCPFLIFNLTRAHLFIPTEQILQRVWCCRYCWDCLSFYPPPFYSKQFQVLNIPGIFTLILHCQLPWILHKTLFPRIKMQLPGLTAWISAFTCLTPKFSCFLLQSLVSFLHLPVLGGEVDPAYLPTSPTSQILKSGHELMLSILDLFLMTQPCTGRLRPQSYNIVPIPDVHPSLWVPWHCCLQPQSRIQVPRWQSCCRASTN